MSLEALASSELPNFIIFDTINASTNPLINTNEGLLSSSSMYFGSCNAVSSVSEVKSVEQEKRKRRRKNRACKNKEEAENQRMTHIAVERNRRRQMNEHLAVLRSLMPESHVQRGDQASIVGGAIDFVKELEQHLQSLEVQKRKLQHQNPKCREKFPISNTESNNSTSSSNSDVSDSSPFAHFFSYPQYTMCNAYKDYVQPENRSSVANIEVSLIETHANLRILSPKRPRQLIKMVAGLQALRLSVLHLNVTTLDSLVLYSLSVKLEEGCSLTNVDDIATAVHQMLILIEAELTAHSR